MEREREKSVIAFINVMNISIQVCSNYCRLKQNNLNEMNIVTYIYTKLTLNEKKTQTNGCLNETGAFRCAVRPAFQRYILQTY